MKQAGHSKERPDPLAQTLGEAAGWPPLIADESEDAYERMLGARDRRARARRHARARADP
jgi:hypothetical protein